jgi:RecA-family ATPase
VKLLPDLREFLGTEDPNDDDSVCWIVRDLIPREEPAIIGGPQKAGKTWLMLDLAISVALGLPWAGFKNELARPGRVLTVCLEDHKIRLRNRVWELLRARRMTPNDPTFQEHFRITDHAIALPAHASLMAAALADFAPDLILVDNLRRVMTGDENDSKDAARFNAAWLELSRALRCSVVFLHHTRKAGTQRGNDDMRASDKLRGSGDISAFARNLVMVEPRSDGGNRACSTVEIAGNLDLKRSKFVLEFERVALSVEPGAPQRHVARLSDAGDVTEFEQDRKRNRDSAEMDRARAAARELGLAGRTISSRALELLVGCKKTRAAELLAQLAEEGFVAQTGPRKSYSLVGG